MLGAVPSNAGPPPAFFVGFLAIWGLFAVVAICSIVFAVFCVLDILNRPDWQWSIAEHRKDVWLWVVIIVNLAVFPLVMSFVYWFSIRRQLLVVESAARAGAYGPGYMTPKGWAPRPPVPFVPIPTHPPAWLPDPQNPATLRYWDGLAWTAHTRACEPQSG
jgi:hypothetical protein